MNRILVVAFYFSFLIYSVVALPGNCVSCKCEDKESSVCNLETRVKQLERSMKEASDKIEEWVGQQYTIRDLEWKATEHGQKVKELEERIKVLEAEKKRKFVKPEALTMPTNNNQNNEALSDAPKSDIAILSKNLTSLIRKVDEMESKTIKNLTMDVVELQGDLLGETRNRRSIETNLSAAIEHLQRLDNSSAGCVQIQDRLSIVELSIIDQRSRQDMVLNVLDKKFAYVEAAIETLSVCNDTWYNVHEVSLQNLSLNQGEIKDLKQELSDMSFTLKSLQEEVSNISNEVLIPNTSIFETLERNREIISSQNVTFFECLDIWKKIKSMDVELRNSYNKAEARIFGNLLAYMETVDKKFERASIRVQNDFEGIYFSLQQLRNSVDEKLTNASLNTQKNLEELYTNFHQLENSADRKLENASFYIENDLEGIHMELHRLKTSVQQHEIDLNKNLSSIIEHLQNGEEQHKETIERLEEYIVSTIDDWKKIAAAPHLLEASPRNNEISEEHLLPGIDNAIIKPEHDDTEEQGWSCFFPKVLDLLVAKETSLGLSPLHVNQSQYLSNGTKLKFGCENIGSSILIDQETEEPITINFSLECVDGLWMGGNVPSCKTLMTEPDILDLSRQLRFLDMKVPSMCLDGSTVPDINDYTRYFQCTNGIFAHLTCNRHLAFNATAGYCDFPSNDRWQIRGSIDNIYEEPEYYGSDFDYNENNIKIDPIALSSSAPTIVLEPNRLNMAYSLMATGPIGELVLYPGSYVTLNCLFPSVISTPSPYPLWLINSSYPEETRQFKASPYKTSLRLISVTTEDSGIYSCVAPNGVKHDIQLIVKDVECPSLYAEPGNALEITHRPHPDVRSNSMSSQVYYRCRGGYKNLGASTAICTVSGSWSHPPPLCQKHKDLEDVSEQPDFLHENNCFPFDLSIYPDLTVVPRLKNRQYYAVGDRIYFSCKNGSMINGPETAMCMKGGQWSIPYLPSCVDTLW